MCDNLFFTHVWYTNPHKHTYKYITIFLYEQTPTIVDSPPCRNALQCGSRLSSKSCWPNQGTALALHPIVAWRTIQELLSSPMLYMQRTMCYDSLAHCVLDRQVLSISPRLWRSPTVTGIPWPTISRYASVGTGSDSSLTPSHSDWKLSRFTTWVWCDWSTGMAVMVVKIVG